MSTESRLVVEAETSAGVAGRHFAHRWRHSYATSLVRRGEDIHVVQRLMGHSNIVLFNADGDPIAESVRPMGLASAKKSVEWLKANIADCDWNQPAIGLFDRGIPQT